MTSIFPIDDVRTLRQTIDSKAYDIFKGVPGKAPLQVTRVLEEKEHGDSGVRTSKFEKNENVWDTPHIEKLQNATDSIQIYSVRQDHSWTTLNIQREVFESLLNIYRIFQPFWKCVFTFGRKVKEIESQFPGFSRRRTRMPGTVRKYTHEISYMLRRVENNGREDHEDDAWSIRQTAVYHKLTPLNSSSCMQSNSNFLLIAPSPNAEQQYCNYLADVTATSSGVRVSPWNVHRLLVADSVRGWTAYLASIENRLTDRSDRIVSATVGESKTNLSPLTDFVINFEDRQELKILEDLVTDLHIILPELVNTVTELRELCKICWQEFENTEEAEAEHEAIMDSFQEYIRELQMNSDRAKVLKTAAKSTTQLLSDLLSYEEAITLKELTKKSQEENASMLYLAKRSTKDAAAVKILTIITLIYLPTTIVANFFSTEFVSTSATGHMSLANNVWLLFAIAIPLTAFTIFLWWGWVHFTRVPEDDDINPDTKPEVRRQHSFRAVLSGKRRSFRFGKKDLESGLGAIDEKAGKDAKSSPAGTWSTFATTVNSG